MSLSHAIVTLTTIQNITNITYISTPVCDEKIYILELFGKKIGPRPRLWNYRHFSQCNRTDGYLDFTYGVKQINSQCPWGYPVERSGDPKECVHRPKEHDYTQEWKMLNINFSIPICLKSNDLTNRLLSGKCINLRPICPKSKYDFSSRICIKPQKSECIIGNSSTNISPIISVQWPNDNDNYTDLLKRWQEEDSPEMPNFKKRPIKITCSYNTSHIDRVQQIYAFQKLANRKDYDDLMMNKCVMGFERNHTFYNACTSWYDKLPNQTRFVNNYCNIHKDHYECKCFLRNNNDDFKNKQTIFNISSPTHCWYKPCEYDFFSNHTYKCNDNTTNICDIIQKHTSYLLFDRNEIVDSCEIPEIRFRDYKTKMYFWISITMFGCITVSLIFILYHLWNYVKLFY